MQKPSDLLQKVVAVVREAEVAVMEIYNSGDFEVEVKDDNSPLTRADKAANKIIEDGLKQISGYPIMSEEGVYKINAAKFWCVDPIDGTKEFIKRNGEFTINIGLIENGEPVLGVVSAPAQKVIYYGIKEYGAFKQNARGTPQRIEAKFSRDTPVVAVSRSHLNQATEEFLAGLGSYELIQTGSSIKFCLVAEGAAALYPRLGPSHLWDTAAADAVLRAAGGKTISATDGRTLVYDAGELINPSFTARAGDYQ